MRSIIALLRRTGECLNGLLKGIFRADPRRQLLGVDNAPIQPSPAAPTAPGAPGEIVGNASTAEVSIASFPIHPSWKEPLAPVEGVIRELDEFLREEAARGRRYLPAHTEALRVFRYPFEHVKVLVVGDQPAAEPEWAAGLSFGVWPEAHRIPASLKNLLAELHDDLQLPPPDTGDLTPWCEHGVALLNLVLTTDAQTPGAHAGRGWERVAECAVRALVQRETPLVAVLWGQKIQQTVRPWLGETPCVCSAHPSPLTARGGFFGSRPFSKVNELLVAQGTEPVDWSLPHPSNEKTTAV